MQGKCTQLKAVLEIVYGIKNSNFNDLFLMVSFQDVRFLDSISDFIYVMMDCVDFSVQNNRASSPFTSRANLTPGGKSRQSEKPLGNLTSLVALSAKVLSISYRIDKASHKLCFTSNFRFHFSIRLCSNKSQHAFIYCIVTVNSNLITIFLRINYTHTQTFFLTLKLSDYREVSLSI